ncbi:unnamed protein product [Rangifer tarandus platyrhynchus]|uniref:Uncharacterized protein n=1 Tax=Rangifer tarandus platyrhynchus TaxID=3082113 RepID=A0ACB1MJU4_RANTA
MALLSVARPRSQHLARVPGAEQHALSWLSKCEDAPPSVLRPCAQAPSTCVSGATPGPSASTPATSWGVVTCSSLPGAVLPPLTLLIQLLSTRRAELLHSEPVEKLDTWEDNPHKSKPRLVRWDRDAVPASSSGSQDTFTRKAELPFKALLTHSDGGLTPQLCFTQHGYLNSAMRASEGS